MSMIQKLMSNKSKGEVVVEMIMRKYTNERINSRMIRFFGESKGKKKDYMNQIAWYKSDLRKKGFVIETIRKSRGTSTLDLDKLAEKYGVEKIER